MAAGFSRRMNDPKEQGRSRNVSYDIAVDTSLHRFRNSLLITQTGPNPHGMGLCEHMNPGVTGGLEGHLPQLRAPPALAHCYSFSAWHVVHNDAIGFE